MVFAGRSSVLWIINDGHCYGACDTHHGAVSHCYGACDTNHGNTNHDGPGGRTTLDFADQPLFP